MVRNDESRVFDIMAGSLIGSIMGWIINTGFEMAPPAQPLAKMITATFVLVVAIYLVFGLGKMYRVIRI
jgi:hypothetical protein